MDDPSTNPEPASDDKPGTEAASAAEEPAAVEPAAVEPAVVPLPCLASASPESAGSGDSSQPPTCSEGNTEVLHVLHSS